ncbi:unnamed protein product [marine sediment metagenome]|uniref:Uncharacterized protein n=1 Tax=marine sediment metagenome TaxID=412755 RepID=X0UDA3_9ZZZZ
MGIIKFGRLVFLMVAAHYSCEALIEKINKFTAKFKKKPETRYERVKRFFKQKVFSTG